MKETSNNTLETDPTSSTFSTSVLQPGKNKQLRISWTQKRTLWAYIFISVPFLYFLIVNFGSMLAAFSYSFQNYFNSNSQRTFIGLVNYNGIFNDPEFWHALRNTLMVVVIRVPVLIVLSLGIALLLSSIKHFKGFFRMLYFLPFVTSSVSISWVFKFMYLPNFGIFSLFLDLMNIRRIAFLYDPNWALIAIVAVTIWANIGFYALIFLTGLEDIPTDYYEAAKVDGANSWQRFWHITIPLLDRTFMVVTMYCLIISLQTFTYVRMMSADMGFGGPLDATITLPIMIYKEAFFSQNMGRASAISVIFFLIVLVLSLLQRKVLSREVEY